MACNGARVGYCIDPAVIDNSDLEDNSVALAGVSNLVSIYRFLVVIYLNLTPCLHAYLLIKKAPSSHLMGDHLGIFDLGHSLCCLGIGYTMHVGQLTPYIESTQL
jgi:hypothetical protein